MARKRPDQKPEISPLAEVGGTGLRSYAGVIQDEWLAELKGTKRLKTFREMAENEAIISASLATIRQLIRQVPLRFEGGDDQRREFIQSLPGDMSLTWQDTLSEVLSMLWAGWAATEIVYKQRLGMEPGSYADSGGKMRPAATSRYNDGLYGWRKLAIRSQESLYQWELDDEGGVQAMTQQLEMPRYRMATIPIERLLLFKTDANKGSPEGRSMLRGCFVSYYFLREIRRTEGVGIARDLAGLPVMYAPAEVCSATAVGDAGSMRDALLGIIKNVKRDSQEGVLLPGTRDSSGNRHYSLELLASGGKRNFDTSQIIDRYQRDIAIALLCDFLLLGHEKVGSFALASSKTSITAMAVAGWVDSLLEVFNRHAIPRILRLNGMPTEDAPRICRGDIETPDLVEVSQYISSLVGCGAIIPTPELEEHLLALGSFPTLRTEDGAEVGKRDIAALSALGAAAVNLRKTTALLRGQMRDEVTKEAA